MVIRNLRRFTEPQHAHEYPLCSRLIADFERKEVLYLAGLFHDIAKGRGGDHSRARRARRAALLPRARPAGARTPSSSPGWSRSHLTMSSTAQKQDITDPDVVAAFAARGRHRAPPGRALPAHGRRHPRHEPEGVERVEGASCSRTCSTRRARGSPAPPARRRSPTACRQRQQRGAAPAAPVRGPRRRRAGAVDAARHASTSSATPPTRSPGTRAISTGASSATEPGRAGAAVARRRRAAGARVPARPEGPVRAHLRLLRPRRACRSSRRRSTRRATATRSTRSLVHDPARAATRRTARRSSWSSSS